MIMLWLTCGGPGTAFGSQYKISFLRKKKNSSFLVSEVVIYVCFKPQYSPSFSVNFLSCHGRTQILLELRIGGTSVRNCAIMLQLTTLSSGRMAWTVINP